MFSAQACTACRACGCKTSPARYGLLTCPASGQHACCCARCEGFLHDDCSCPTAQSATNRLQGSGSPETSRFQEDLLDYLLALQASAGGINAVGVEALTDGDSLCSQHLTLASVLCAATSDSASCSCRLRRAGAWSSYVRRMTSAPPVPTSS